MMRSKSKTFHSGTPDDLVDQANQWMKDNPTLGLASEAVFINIDPVGEWHITVLIRDKKPLQRLNYTQDISLWQLGKNIFNTGFKFALSIRNSDHYFGSRLV